MKAEQKQLLGFVGRMLILIGFASLYAIGGSGDFWGGEKWIRRFLAPALLCGTGAVIAWDWRQLVSYPLMAGALCLPYGVGLGETTLAKVLGRLVFGLACSVAFNIPNALNGRWTLVILGLNAGILASVALGVFNPTSDAMVEQGCIAFLIAFTYVVGAQRKPKGETK